MTAITSSPTATLATPNRCQAAVGATDWVSNQEARPLAAISTSTAAAAGP